MKKAISAMLCLVMIFSVFSVSLAAKEEISTAEFDAGMKKGIEYFNKGYFREAVDEFQWFCDANWHKMNAGQQKYALDYLGAAKANKKNQDNGVNKTEKKISTSNFDAGMKKGIEYFNKSYFREAVDEFQWFCDANWHRMNEGQQKYVLGYLDSAKAKLSEYIKMYKYSNGIISTSVHKNREAEMSKQGWSTQYPAPKYEPTIQGLQNMAIYYWKDCLYWPDQATLHNIRVGSKRDDWDRGTLSAEIYIDGTVLTDAMYYSRRMFIVSLTFNKYTGNYTLNREVDEIR